MISMPWLVLLPLVAVLALLVGYFGSRAATARTLGDAETRASRILEDAKRLVDFAAGLVFGLRGSIERVTQKVFLLSPANVDVTAEDKARIAEGGFFNQS